MKLFGRFKKTMLNSLEYKYIQNNSKMAKLKERNGETMFYKKDHCK